MSRRQDRFGDRLFDLVGAPHGLVAVAHPPPGRPAGRAYRSRTSGGYAEETLSAPPNPVEATDAGRLVGDALG